MSGQTCVAQFSEAAPTGKRSPLARTGASRAATLGAKAGKAITEIPRSANAARAEKDLNIVWVLTLVGLNPTALGDSHPQQPEQQEVPRLQLLFVARFNRDIRFTCKNPVPLAGEGLSPCSDRRLRR